MSAVHITDVAEAVARLSFDRVVIGKKRVQGEAETNSFVTSEGSWLIRNSLVPLVEDDRWLVRRKDVQINGFDSRVLFAALKVFDECL